MDLSESRRKLERYCEEQEFAGHCKFDALNSPWLEKWLGSSPVSRLLISQLVNRVPLPLRSLFRVAKARNPKGIANFIIGYCRSLECEPNDAYATKANELANWLMGNDSHAHGAYSGVGKAWGYQFPWQSPGFFAPRHSPNCIVTTFCGDALLAIYRAHGDERALQAAKGAARFVLEGLPVLEEDSESKCIGYVPCGPRWKVVNINAVAAGFLAKLARAIDDKRMAHEARRLLNWVVKSQSREGRWNYTHPRHQSGIGPDNYHTGGILDGVLDHMEATGDRDLAPLFLDALGDYRESFFTDEGAPKWRVNRAFPQDIHGAAQGILTFSRACLWDPSYLETAEAIATWAITRMQDPRGHFYYQRYPGFTWKLDLMRWNNSWMFRALAELELAQHRLRRTGRIGKAACY